jgi:hypothetical protein
MSKQPDVMPDTKKCPICCEVLLLSEFGVCRARKDGRNLYCKSCIRKKVSESRRALKAYKSARQKYASQKMFDTGDDFEVLDESDSATPRLVCRQISKMSPVERVREAIRKGARTQKEIAQETKLGKDDIGDALANLLLWTREIRTEVVDNTRMYFTNESVELDTVEVTSKGSHTPRRKGDVPSSFSSLQSLMPGKNPEGELEKIGGWVAA